MTTLTALLAGYALDLCLGDPHGFPHPVVFMGNAIAFLEKKLRSVFPKTPRGERIAGAVLCAVLPALSFFIVYDALAFIRALSPWAAFALEAFWCYQILATRSLRDESMLVHAALVRGDLSGARYAVSRIVGRDTDALDEEGVARAAVETVAENASDGVVAPMIFLAIGGAPLGMLYKAVNTMDSMIGYKNERYLHFGRAAAKLDDALNFIPARLSGLLMSLCAFLTGLDGRGALRVFFRDRLAHASPNSGHTEAACAGALGVRLGGASVYKGVLVDKPAIGDASRPVETADIARANRLMIATSLASLVLCALARFLWGVLL